MEKLIGTDITINNFTLFLSTKECPIHKIVLGSNRCHIIDVGGKAFPIKDGIFSFSKGLMVFRVRGSIPQYDLFFNQRLSEDEIDRYDINESDIEYVRKSLFSNKKVPLANGWCKLKERMEVDMIIRGPLLISNITALSLEQREEMWKSLIEEKGVICEGY